MKNRFLSISIGVTLMLFGIGFILRSIPVANAAPAPEAFVEEGTNKIGKYMFQIYLNSEGGRRAIVWDTETGRSQAYYFNNREFVVDTEGFPEKPLGE